MLLGHHARNRLGCLLAVMRQPLLTHSYQKPHLTPWAQSLAHRASLSRPGKGFCNASAYPLRDQSLSFEDASLLRKCFARHLQSRILSHSSQDLEHLVRNAT